MVGLKHFQNKAHSNMCMKPKRVCERHGMVLLCGLVPGQAFSSKWLTLGSVKRWCICGLSSSLLHSFNPRDDLLKATFLFASCIFLYLIPRACNWQATLRNQPDKRSFFLLMCVSVNMCVPGGGRPGQKWLIILTNIWIFTSSTAQVSLNTSKQCLQFVSLGI